MYKNHLLLIVTTLFLFTTCANRKLSKSQSTTINELAKVMTGKFSSAEQAAQDSSFYNISLVMHPIWENDKNSKWLYVEQAVAAYADKPYRQRVYQIKPTAEKDIFESKVFELPSPSKYIHAWDDPSIFKKINQDSLIVRQGCSVFLKKTANNCYTGSTRDKECKSSLRGASYATSKVTICPDEVLSWDQGWDNTDKQVWGATESGYVFKKE